MTTHYSWPSPPGCDDQPVWTGHGFQLGDTLRAVLLYGTSAAGWTDELTTFHEDTAGAHHFIDEASRRHALQQLRQHVSASSPVILEVGCSSGFMLRLIREHFPHALMMGSDVVCGPLAQLALDMPDIPLLQFDLANCPLPDNSLDAVVLLNVLEHIEDDAGALQHIHRMLKPGGIAVIEVPAGPHLYDVYDRLLLHYRRYALTALRRLVEDAHLHVVEQSHLGCFLYPGFWLVKQRNKRFLTEEDIVHQRIVTQNISATKNSRLMDTVMRIELALGQYISYPFGIRCLLTCVKMK
jgi:SAM-dependent methyltransferase